MFNRSQAKRNASVAANLSWLRGSRISRGQSMVEFALGAAVALAVMLIGIQFAIIGQAALAVSQSSSALARYASVNPGTLGYNGTVAMPLPAAAEQLLSSSITTSTISGTPAKTVYDLTVKIKSLQASDPTKTTNAPTTQDQVVISLSYNAAKKIVLPSATLLGITFPTTLNASDSQIYAN